jgi:hypothetical protein
MMSGRAMAIAMVTIRASVVWFIVSLLSWVCEARS